MLIHLPPPILVFFFFFVEHARSPTLKSGWLPLAPAVSRRVDIGEAVSTWAEKAGSCYVPVASSLLLVYAAPTPVDSQQVPCAVLRYDVPFVELGRVTPSTRSGESAD